MQTKSCRFVAGFLSFFFLLSAPPILILVLAACYFRFQASIRARLRALRRRIRQTGWFPRMRLTRRRIRNGLSPLIAKINGFVDAKYATQKLAMALSSLAVVGSVVWLIAHLRGTDTVDDYLAYCFKQIGITVLLGISITALAWVLFPLKRMLDNLLFKLVASFVVTLTIVFSRLLATDFFSTHFPFPPSYMALAYGIGTGIIATALTSTIFALFALLFEIVALLALSARDLKTNRWATFALAVFAGIGLFGAYISSFALFEGINPKGQLFMVKIAEKYDFTTNHMCEATSEESVLFIENVSDRAIAATFPGTTGINPQTLTAESLPTYLPKNFRTVRCNPLSPVAGTPNWCKDFSRFGFCETND